MSPSVGGLGSSVGIGLDIGWTVRGSSPSADDIFPAVHTGTEDHPASSTMGTGSLSRGKCSGPGADHLANGLKLRFPPVSA